MLTKKQTEQVLSKFIAEENGLNTVLQMMLNAMMYSEENFKSQRSIGSVHSSVSDDREVFNDLTSSHLLFV